MNASQTIIKRLPQNVEQRQDITTFGADNLYPQRAEEVYLRSPIAKSCIEKQAEFLYGEGFENNGDLIVNRYNQTMNDILRGVVKDYSPFHGWSLYFNVNEIGGITEILPLKFKNVRYGLPNVYGRHRDVKYNLNWERDFSKTIEKVERITTFPLWDVRDETLKKVDDIEKFEGFVHYWTPERDLYPTASFDAVFDSAQTNGELQVFELSTIQNGFLGTSIYLHRGPIANEKERQNIINNLYQLTGPENAGGVTMFEVPVDFDGNLLEQVPANNNDRLFELTNDVSRERVVSNYGIPFPILGIQPDGGIFNQEQLRDSFISYNTATRGTRKILVTEFEKFMAFWHTGAVEFGSIVESKFEIQNGGNDTDNQE